MSNIMQPPLGDLHQVARMAKGQRITSSAISSLALLITPVAEGERFRVHQGIDSRWYFPGFFSKITSINILP
jgi:hypothetical protein